MNQSGVQAHKCYYDVPTDCSACRGEGSIEDEVFGLIRICYACGGTGAGPMRCAQCIDEEEEL